MPIPKRSKTRERPQRRKCGTARTCLTSTRRIEKSRLICMGEVLFPCHLTVNKRRWPCWRCSTCCSASTIRKRRTVTGSAGGFFQENPPWKTQTLKMCESYVFGTTALHKSRCRLGEVPNIKVRFRAKRGRCHAAHSLTRQLAIARSPLPTQQRFCVRYSLTLGPRSFY